MSRGAWGKAAANLLFWLLVAATGVSAGALLYRPAIRLLYPVPYRDVVTRHARAHELDPFLLAAVIRVESGFNARAVSPKGARGLMQVMPETAQWVAGQLGLGELHPDSLFDPEDNVRFGAWYLAYLLDLFDGSLTLALAAYNGGRGNVALWMEERRWQGETEALDRIPFPETRTYVDKVLRTYRGYRRVYRGRWEETALLLHSWAGEGRQGP